MADWVRWEKEADAKACLDMINNSKLFPIIGLNAKTLVSTSEKQQTLRWAFLTKCEDGKYGFQKPDADMLKKLELDKTIFEGSSTEKYNSTWVSGENE